MATLGTQTFNRADAVVGPRDGARRRSRLHDKGGKHCTLYVGAAGGGDLADATTRSTPNPHWAPVSGDIPSTAIGSLLVDPTDQRGSTIYVGTGEANGSSDCEAGLGLYKSTDGGDHWTLVTGSTAVSSDRSIGAIAVDPAQPASIS